MKILFAFAMLTFVAASWAAKPGGTEPITEKPQFLGVTTELLGGGRVGTLEATELCQLDFPGSRFCTSIEIMETTLVPEVVFPPGPTAPSSAWVRPVIVGYQYNDSSSYRKLDASGVSAADLICQGGDGGSGAAEGLTVRGNGYFSLNGCLSQLPVACCGPAQ